MEKIVQRLKINRYEVIWWLALVAILFFGAIVFMYSDITNTIDNANILIHSVNRGKMLNFYELTVKESVTNYAANYNFPVYVLFALWQLPVYLITNALHVNYMHTPWALFWSKMLVILFALAVAYFMYKIVALLSDDRRLSSLAVALYCSSVMVFYPVFLCGQLDVIAMTFMLWGIERYFKNDMKGFWLLYLIAVPFKMFALLLALPFILARVKNLLKAGLIWFSMTGLIIVENLLFHNSPIHYYALQAQSNDALSGLLGAHITLGQPLVIFLAVYFSLVLYAWMKEKITASGLIYMSFILWGTFVCFSRINTYWIFLAVPFMIMTMCIRKRFLLYNLMLSTLSGLFYFLKLVCGGTKVFQNTHLVSHLFLPWLMSVPAQGQLKYGSLMAFSHRLELTRYTSLFTTAFVFTLLAVMVLTSSKLQTKSLGTIKNEKQNIKIVLAFRPIIILSLTGLVLFAYTAKTNPIAYDTRNGACQVSSADLTSSKHHIMMQPVVFHENRKLDELVLKLKNTRPVRSNMALLDVRLIDMKTKKEIFKKKIGVSSIKNSRSVYIDLNHTPVRKGRIYAIQLSGEADIAFYRKKTHLYPYTTALGKDLDPLDVDGKKQQGHLYFMIR